MGEAAGEAIPAGRQDVLVALGGRTGPEKRPREAGLPREFEVAEDELLEDGSSESPRGEVGNAVEVRQVDGARVAGRFVEALRDVHHEQQQVHAPHRLHITAGTRTHLEQTHHAPPRADLRGNPEVLEVPPKAPPRGNRHLLR